jgi:hypothetical protein
MATIGNTKSIPNPGYNPWTSKVELDTDTGKQMAYVYGGSGKLLYSGTPQEVVSQIPSNTAYNSDKAFFNGLISTIDGQSSGLTAQYQQQVPPPNTEPVPAAAEATPDKNNLTGSADGDSGSEAKNNEGKNSPPTASGVSTDNNTSAKTQNLNYSGTTQAGSANNSDKSAGYTTGDLPGKRLQNPLSSLSSYTYQTTLYMITPDAYKAFIESGRTNLDAIKNAKDANAAASTTDNMSGAYIIAQSGGVNNTDNLRAFNLDYYIDDLRVTNVLQGPATGTSSNDLRMSFNIYEPYGFSLITKLTNAANKLRSVSKVKNYSKMSNATRQFFILGIRFQGYDVDGKVISASDTFFQDNFNVANDSGGVFERFFDIYISSFKFKLDGKVTVYNIEAVPIGPGTALGVKRGRIDKNVEVQGSTVDDVLQDLVKHLNNEQQKIADADPKKESIPTKYKIEYVGGAKELIGDQPIVNIYDTVKDKWPMGEGIPNLAAVNANAEFKAFPNSTKRSLKFKNGGSIMQCIQNIITQSDYMAKALTTLFTNDDQPNPKPNSDYIRNNNKPRTFRWYNLSSEVKVLGFDNSVKDFAFEITYIIQPYDTPYVKSQSLQATTRYYGPHKRYSYWYTGKNSEILSYEQTMNNTYFNAVINPGATSASSGGGYDVPSSTGKFVNEDKTGLLDMSKQTQNSVITSLFSPADYAMVKFTIIGDPDYLMTESSSSLNNVYRQFYGKGFTINPNGGQVFIEIDFKEAVDYNLSTGTMDINESILFWNYPKEIQNLVKGVSYMVREVQHTFSKGKFTQELTCNINTFNNYRSGVDSNPNRAVESASNANSSNQAQGDVRTSKTQAGGNSESSAPTSGNTGFKGDAPVQTINPNSGNQGGSNVNATSPNAANQSNDDAVINKTVLLANQGGRENPPTGQG